VKVEAKVGGLLFGREEHGHATILCRNDTVAISQSFAELAQGFLLQFLFLKFKNDNGMNSF